MAETPSTQVNSDPKTNREFVEWMCTEGMITDDVVQEAFLAADRADYCPIDPYRNFPSQLGHFSVSSVPVLHTSGINALLSTLVPQNENESKRVFEVGCGCGYTTHVLAELAGKGSIVVGIENVPELRDMAERNFRRTERGRYLLDTGRVHLVLGDARQGLSPEARKEIAGFDAETKFDAIYAAASSATLPQELERQLNTPGSMFIPLKSEHEDRGPPDGHWTKDQVWRFFKDEHGNLEKTIVHHHARYVKLREARKVDVMEKEKDPYYRLFPPRPPKEIDTYDLDIRKWRALEWERIKKALAEHAK